jgi:hypothetical protein
VNAHTPGPWKLFDDERHERIEVYVTEGGFEKVIATLDTGFREPFESQQRANAKLIAEAPAMAQTLRDINVLACYASEENTDDREAALLEVGKKARAVLEKAGVESF